MNSMKRSSAKAVLALAIMTAFAFSLAQTASANWVNGYGNYTVCLATYITHYLDTGGIVNLSAGHIFNVTGYRDNGNHVWGYNQGGRYGYVYNGWLC